MISFAIALFLVGFISGMCSAACLSNSHEKQNVEAGVTRIGNKAYKLTEIKNEAED